jgi:hypothetical protein
MKHTKYSVLLMRDDSNVRRFRVSPIWLRLGVYAIICLVLLAAGGIVAGYTFWDKNQVLAESRKKMERRLVEMQVRLERLENVQKLLEGTDPEDLTALAGTVGRKAAPTMPGPEIHLKHLFSPFDTHLAKMENLQVQFVNHSMRVSFEVNNLQPNKSLSGDVSFKLITNAGKQFKVDANSKHLNFSIQRFKRIITKFRLPKDVARDDIFALQVKIVSPKGDMIFSDTFPIYRIVS